MFDLERWQEIFEAIAKNKLRTFLTGVSVASGIFILVILLGAGRGLQNGIENQFANDAANLVMIWTSPTTKAYKGLNAGRQIQLKNQDFEQSSRQFEKNIDLKSPVYNVWSGVVSYGKETGTYRINGINPDYQFIENASLVEGRFLNQLDIKNYEKTVLIGNKVKMDLFKKKENPIGALINIAGGVYKVIGVFTDPGGEREEARVYLPLSTAQRAFSGADKVGSLNFTLKKRKSFEDVVAESEYFKKGVSDLLKQKNTIAPDDTGGIFVYNTLEDVKKFYDLNNMIRWFFWGVGICTIIAGVVGVSNIMLIIVKERTKEIGIRKALGAPPISIVTMILHESIFVTTIAGFIGLISSLLLLELIGPQIKSDFFMKPEVDFNIALTTLVILIVAGAIAGFFPAYRAAKIKPIIALRDE
ncbi:ABC transporter permease [Flavobacterium sp. '19STA2R22 D10 B1']|uniref:ABC transporter permease n=1 Tax=Flavobacterium aerium TaxID=3037261 RepID=UPI00278C8AA9|nr:ABC transporter permease [Flavobacterium sp. '19STA2R22 D10 B1']